MKIPEPVPPPTTLTSVTRLCGQFWLRSISTSLGLTCSQCAQNRFWAGVDAHLSQVMRLAGDEVRWGWGVPEEATRPSLGWGSPQGSGQVLTPP